MFRRRFPCARMVGGRAWSRAKWQSAENNLGKTKSDRCLGFPHHHAAGTADHQANKEFLTEEEALKLERDIVERNRSSMSVRPRGRPRVATSTGVPTAHRASITTSGWTAEQSRSPPGGLH